MGTFGHVDQSEFARRIKAYLQRDLPGVDADRVAASLAPALFQYVRTEEGPPRGRSAFLEGLLPRNALLLFTATWDGNSQRYRPTVFDVAARVGRPVIEVDVDDPVGGAIARHYGVLTTPTVVDAHRAEVIDGERTTDELTQRLDGA